MLEIDETIATLQADIDATAKMHRGLTGLLNLSQGESRAAIQAAADWYAERGARLEGMQRFARLLKEQGDEPADVSAEVYASLERARQAVHEAFTVFRPPPELRS